MTGGFSQQARVYASLDAVPPHDRWEPLPLITTRCIPVDSDKITDMTLEQWRAEMALKYGEDGRG